MDSFIGEIRICSDSGAIYFDSNKHGGRTILRIQGLPPIPKIGPSSLLDMKVDFDKISCSWSIPQVDSDA